MWSGVVQPDLLAVNSKCWLDLHHIIHLTSPPSCSVLKIHLTNTEYYMTDWTSVNTI